MDDVANYADEMAVIHRGKLIAQGLPQTVFNNSDLLQEDLLTLPRSAEFAQELSQQGFHFKKLPITIKELGTEIKQQLNGDFNG